MAATAAASSSSTMPAASWDEAKLARAKIKDHAAPANSTTIAKRRIAEANRRAAAGWTMERIMSTAWDPRRTARYCGDDAHEVVSDWGRGQGMRRRIDLPVVLVALGSTLLEGAPAARTGRCA
jgi:hypothetical protein